MHTLRQTAARGGFWADVQMWQISVAASGGNILQKLGRVLKEKATGDIDRVFKGTSKTRQKLGVPCFPLPNSCTHTCTCACTYSPKPAHPVTLIARSHPQTAQISLNRHADAPGLDHNSALRHV